MNIDQRTILEILLNLYKIESKYQDSISGTTQYVYKPLNKGNKRTYKQYVNFEEYDEELSSSEQQNDLDNSITLSRQSSQQPNTDEDVIEDFESDDPAQQQEQLLNIHRDQEISDKQTFIDQDSTREQMSTTISTISKQTQKNNRNTRYVYLLNSTSNMNSKQKQLDDRLKYFFQYIDNQQLYDQYLQHKLVFKDEIDVQFSNIGILKQKMLNNHLNTGSVVYEPLKDSVNNLLSDYVISAYAYDFTAIRLQQSNILIRMYYKIQQILDLQELSKQDEMILDQMLQTIQQIEKRNQEIRSKTVFCCQKIMATHSDKFLICNSCGKLCNFMKKSVRKDRNEGSQRNTSYHSIRHFDDVFKQLFIQPIEPIDSITKLQLQEFMIRDHKQKVTIEDVRQYLKQLPGGKGSKLNKSDAFIMGILNGETLKISNIEYQFIKNTFQQFIQILYKNAETRKNTPNCVSFIKKIIDLLYKDIDPARHQQIVKRLHQQKENTTRKMQKTWQFLIEQFDVKQLKQDFKDTIRQQTHKINDSSKVLSKIPETSIYML